MRRLHRLLPPGLRALLSPGVTVILLIAIATTIGVGLRPKRELVGQTLWVSSRPHYLAYVPLAEQWNAAHPASPVRVALIEGTALERRMLSGFMSGTPVAEMIEVNTNIAGRAFRGPLAEIGFTDITQRLVDEGLREKITAASFSPWTTRGRTFGLPHDVHPVVLVYRADIIEAAGIDMTQIETWDDFTRLLRPLMADANGDGRPDRYLIDFWHTRNSLAEALILQAGGRLFDEGAQPVIADAPNALTLSRLALWTAGPDRIAIDATEFTAAGNQLKLEGAVVAALLPDWLAGVWKQDLPGLGGKLKIMPLPAWTPGGRRTSVIGGTMLGIPKSTEDFEAAWAFAKHLYLSPQLAEQVYRDSNIISPVKALWDLPIYRAPDPYFSGQPAGSIYISLADDVPVRVISPFSLFTNLEISNILHALQQEANRLAITDPALLQPLAQRLLDELQRRVLRQMARNVFLRAPAPAADPADPAPAAP